MKIKQNFKFGDRVKITPDYHPLKGTEGTIAGLVSIGWYDVYIISFDQPVTTDIDAMPTFSAIAISEFDLEKAEAL